MEEGQGRKDNQEHGDRVTEPFQELFLLGPGPGSTIFPWEMTSLGSGPCSLPHQTGEVGRSLPMSDEDPDDTAITSLLGGPPSAPLLLPPFPCLPTLVGGGALAEFRLQQGRSDFLPRRTTPRVGSQRRV